MTSSYSFKENTVTPLVLLETTWSSASSELNCDAASYQPDQCYDAVVLPQPPPPLLLCNSSEFYMKTQFHQSAHVPSDSYYHPHRHQYLTGYGAWGNGNNSGFVEHQRHPPRMDLFYPRPDFYPNPYCHNNPHQYQRHHQLCQQQGNPHETMRITTSGMVLPTSMPQGEPTCVEEESVDASASPRHSPDPVFYLTHDYENDDKPANTGEGIIGHRSVFTSTTNINAEKLTHSESQSKSDNIKPVTPQKQQHGPSVTATVAVPTIKVDSHSENNKIDFSATVAPMPLPSGVPTQTTGYVYDGTLEPLKSLALGLYESSSLWSTNPPWAGLFGVAPNYAAVARTKLTKCTAAAVDDALSHGAHDPTQDLLDQSLTDATNKALPLQSVAEYEMTIERLSEKDPPDTAGAEALLHEMLRAEEEGLEGNIHPTESCYNSVIHAYRLARQPRQAERILRLMVDNDRVHPSPRIYMNVIKAWAKSKDLDAPKHCERILRDMHSLSDSLRNTRCKPTVAIVTPVLACWAQSGQEGGAERAAVLLQQMKTRFLNGDAAVRPELHCYSIVLAAFARESNMDAAENTMWEIVDDFVSGIIAAEPRARDLNYLLSMYARDGTEEAVQHAECVLARFRELHVNRLLTLKPDGHTAIWLKLLLHKMNENEGKTEATNLHWFSKVSNSIDQSILPNTALYTSLIDSSVAHCDRDAACDLFLLMIDEAMAGNKRVHPDNRILEMLVSAYAGELCHTQKQRPDPRTAEFIMRRVVYLSEKLSQQYAHLHPRLAIYETLVTANCNAENAKRADSLLWECINKKLGTPPKALLKKVEAAWKKSRHPDQQRQLNLVQCFMVKAYGGGKKQTSKRA